MIFKSVQIDNYIKKPDLNIKAILVYGTNEGLQLDTVKRLARTVCEDLQDAFQVVELDGSAAASDIGILYGEYNGQSLMGGRRVIIVNDAGNDLTKHLRKMFDESNSDNLVILSGSSALKKAASLVKLAEDSNDMACFACYEDKSEDIYQVLKGMGLTFEPAAIQLLTSKLSPDRMVNLMELDKLATYMGDAKNVTPQVIQSIVSDASNSSTEDIYYATLEGDREKALKYYNKYLNEGNDVISVIKPIVYHMMKLLVCQANIENGDSVDRAMMKLTPKIMFYRADAFKRQLSVWRKDKIFKALELLYNAEKDCKTTDMPTVEIVSMLLLQLSAASRK